MCWRHQTVSSSMQTKRTRTHLRDGLGGAGLRAVEDGHGRWHLCDWGRADRETDDVSVWIRVEYCSVADGSTRSLRGGGRWRRVLQLRFWCQPPFFWQQVAAKPRNKSQAYPTRIR